MKKSEIKDLYNHSDAALKLLKADTLLLPYSSDQVKANNILKAAAQAAELWKPVKLMCDYMIDDGSIDMRERLLSIKAEVSTIERDAAKLRKDEEEKHTDQFTELCRNCRAIINTIKDMEEWTANGAEPQHKPIAAPQQPSDGSGGELVGSGNETLSEGNADDAEGNDDSNDNYIQLPLSLQTADKRAEKIFKAAVDAEWMTMVDENSAIWYGFVKTKQGNIKCKEISLAYLVHETYNDCNGLWGTIESYFNIQELSKHWGYVKNRQRQQWQNDIDKLISKAIKTSQK